MTVTQKKPESTKPRWKRRPGARPVEIAEAALDIFAKRGFDATTMDEIAARSGVSKGTIYLYFESKEDLLVTSVEHRIRLNQSRVLPLIQMGAAGAGGKLTAESVREILTKIISVVVELLTQDDSQKLIRVIMAERSRIKQLREKQAELARIGLTALTGFFSRAHKSGAIDCPHAETTARMLMGLIVTFVIFREVFNPGRSTRRDPNDLSILMKFAFRGLGLDEGV